MGWWTASNMVRWYSYGWYGSVAAWRGGSMVVVWWWYGGSGVVVMEYTCMLLADGVNGFAANANLELDPRGVAVPEALVGRAWGRWGASQGGWWRCAVGGGVGEKAIMRDGEQKTNSTHSYRFHNIPFVPLRGTLLGGVVDPMVAMARPPAEVYDFAAHTPSPVVARAPTGANGRARAG